MDIKLTKKEIILYQWEYFVKTKEWLTEEDVIEVYKGLLDKIN